MKKVITVLWFLVASVGLVNAQTIYYVTQNGAGTKTGLSWANAFDETGFRSALRTADSSNTFWVAAGTYHPDASVRDSSFHIPSGVKVYGGFPNTGSPTMAMRNWVTNVTTLSGEIGDLFITTDNSYHVVSFAYADSGTVIDGFTITAGNGTGATTNGAGIYNDGSYSLSGSSPSISNCIIGNNHATACGGGIYNNGAYSTGGSSPVISNCTFSNNIADVNGGGIRNDATGGGKSDPVITNCIFDSNTAGSGAGIYNYSTGTNGECAIVVSQCKYLGNVASGDGGAIYNYTGSGGHAYSQFVNCLFAKNKASFGGVVRNYTDNYGLSTTVLLTNCTFADDTATTSGKGSIADNDQNGTGPLNVILTNCIIWNNTAPQIRDNRSSTSATYCDVQGGYIGTGNINADPLFLNPANANYHIASCSPCINVGTATSAPNNDLDGNPRPAFGGYDMGSYESQDTGIVAATVLINAPANDTICPNKATTFTATTNAAFAVHYQWTVNGIQVGSDSVNYTSALLHTGDLLSCKVSTTANCFNPDSAVSSAINLILVPPLTAGFSFTNSGASYNFTDTSLNAITYLWYFGDGDSSTVRNPNHTYSIDSSYTITEIVFNNCGQTRATAILHITTGLNTTQGNVNVSLYPNPASAVLYITYTGGQPDLISIFDINGQKISEGAFTSHLDVSTLSTGVYFIELKSENEVYRSKFVKQ